MVAIPAFAGCNNFFSQHELTHFIVKSIFGFPYPEQLSTIMNRTYPLSSLFATEGIASVAHCLLALSAIEFLHELVDQISGRLPLQSGVL